MDTCGKRLCFAMGTALLLVGLNAVAVLSGSADAFYAHAVNAPPAVQERYAGEQPTVEPDGCSYAERGEQPLSALLPELAAVATAPFDSC